MNEKHFHQAALCNEQMVHIEDVTKEQRAQSKYYCIGCGKEMEACLGDVREHYFRHKNKENCNWESYLHKYAKLVLKERFERQEHLFVYFHARNVCEHLRGCRFDRCKAEFIDRIDLKEHFDTCQVESMYKGFRPDVLLTHSEHPERALFLEVAVNHKCEDEKIKSGIRIIEIDVKDQSTPLIEFFEGYELVHFYNFKFRRDAVPVQEYQRFSMLKDEKGHGICQIDQIKCIDFDKHLDEAEFDVTAKTIPDGMRIEDLGFALCLQRGIEVRHCRYCMSYGICKLTIPRRFRDVDSNIITSTLLIANKLNPWDTAVNCQNYKPNRRWGASVVRKFGEANIFWEKKAIATR